MLVTLSYGSESVEITIPESHPLLELRLQDIRPERAPEEAVRAALDTPIGSKPMEEIFRRGERTVIVVPDGTRQAQTPIFLPLLLNRLNQLGIADHDISVVIASGSHRVPEASEYPALVGEEAAARVAVISHDARNDDALVYLGDTSFGTPVWLNRRVVQSERLVVTGTVAHHYFAGYGGGPKMIMPGCAGYETIRINHSRTISVEHSGLHPGCELGVIEGNPVQEDIRDAMKFVAVDWLLHTILNARGEIVGVVAGEMFAAHAEGCRQIDALYRVPLSERADIVVASCGGFPKDVNFVQAHKSLHNAFRAVKPGGSLLLFAECRNGIGSPTFMEWFQYQSPAAMAEALAENYKLNGHTALSTLQKAKAARIVLVSELDPEDVRRMGLHPAESAEEAWQIATSGLPASATVIAIPHASLTIPQPRDAA
jgi:nickel-dependent lactate racemase